MRPKILLPLLLAAVVAGCDLVDPERPTPYPDTTVYGNLLEVLPPAAPDTDWKVRLRVSVPRELSRAEEAEGTPSPEVEGGLVAEVGVGADAVVVVHDSFADLEALVPGTEVVVVPEVGSTRMVGSNTVLLDARYLLDFTSFAHWQLPKLATVPPAGDRDRSDPTRINSAGVESEPVVPGDGTTLVFSARLRPAADQEGGWLGAVRPGLEVGDDGAPPRERSFRTTLGADGWSAPAPVEFDGPDDARRMVVTWMDPAETRCLVTVEPVEGPPWVGVASRRRAGGRWSAPERIEALGPEDASGAVYLAGSTTKLVFVSLRNGGVQSDLFLHDPAMEHTPLPLEPQINTVGDEWGPRIGPAGELFFVRDEHQLLRQAGTLHEVRLPGPFRPPLTQAAPTSDGRWVFFCLPRLRPLEPDQDIWVAPRLEDGALGVPVPVDDWRPTAD